ncbi:MAG TPA: secondary thiamine-phosphate synthase enzyme YjbQ [Longimicrobiaceae bacterium]|nr:secondary thiamine-phosphate synthase enzyme YjbQ [Longimicrobiaceae bacterium]
MEEIRIRSSARSELIEITNRLQDLVDRSGIREGVLVVQSLHTTAALTVNENADPDVPRDLVAKLERLIPQRESFYQHAEGNSDSHLKTSFFGPSLTVLVHEGRLVLGRWQGVFLCEFDGPRERRVAAQLLHAREERSSGPDGNPTMTERRTG